MSALLSVRNIHVYTHDSIGLGEDGPTHQPVEQVASLRLIPNLQVWRPCDTVESAVAWKAAIENRHAPTALIFTRQGLPHQPRSAEQLENVARGGYVLRQDERGADALILASGSEVGLAMAAADELAAAGVRVSVVSMPNPGLFQQQDQAYRDSVLPPGLRARVAVEAGVSACWASFVGDQGRTVGVDRFGASAPAEALFEHYGLTVENVVRAVRDSLAATQKN
jgi:transketolase